MIAATESLHMAITRSSAEEQSTADIVDQAGDEIHAAVAPHTLSGYFFVEADSRGAVESVANRISTINKVLPGETAMSEVKSFLEEKSDVDDITPGTPVIVTDGAYEGNVAEVTNVNEGEETITVKFPDEPIPIPVELPGSQIRIQQQ